MVHHSRRGPVSTESRRDQGGRRGRKSRRLPVIRGGRRPTTPVVDRTRRKVDTRSRPMTTNDPTDQGAGPPDTKRYPDGPNSSGVFVPSESRKGVGSGFEAEWFSSCRKNGNRNSPSYPRPGPRTDGRNWNRSGVTKRVFEPKGPPE